MRLLGHSVRGWKIRQLRDHYSSIDELVPHPGKFMRSTRLRGRCCGRIVWARQFLPATGLLIVVPVSNTVTTHVLSTNP